jgi:dGTP triphosphohydrolase
MPLSSYAKTGNFIEDIEKIVYSNAYRRLAHKTQLIIKPTRDHFRSRLVHTAEVNHIASSLGKLLGLNIELISAIAQAHDLGHTPFGHAGERAVQNILEIEINNRFQIECPKKEPEKILFRKKLFHHSINSSRILVKEKEFEDISIEIINGVLMHSWNPWQETKKNMFIPNTYEAQVVAIADQIASINHDTEDIIEGEPYTKYTEERFSQEIINGFKSAHKDTYRQLEESIQQFIIDKQVEPGYGRKKRVNYILSDIIKNTKETFKQNNITRSEQAIECPICPSAIWSEFLNYYEGFIRKLIQEKISWFIARDNMASALISTVFTHIWPRISSSIEVSHRSIQPSLFSKEELIKSKYEEKTKYIEHFISFFNQHYIDEENGINFYDAYLKKAKEIKTKHEISLWDLNILDLKQNLSEDDKRLFTKIIAIIDFIAGFTDRYCLEIFDEVYKEFIVT